MKSKFLSACIAAAALMVATSAQAKSPLFRFVQLTQPAPTLAPTPMASPTPVVADPAGPTPSVDSAATAPIGIAPSADPGSEPVAASTCTVPLFNCVRVKDQCNIAPCAVPMVVMVKDPCWVCDPCNPCAGPKCVAVQICVPPCSVCPPTICSRRDGEYVRYDYGRYRVEITSRRGVVTVDYDR